MIAAAVSFSPTPTPRAESSALWKEWFRRQGPNLVLFARQQTSQPSEAEDLVQEAVRKLWQMNPDCPPDNALAYHKIRQLATDFARSRIRRAVREETWESEAPRVEWFDRRAEKTERDSRLESAVRALPPEQREVISLKIWGELTFDQIARTLDISPNTAASRYRYALERLRTLLAPSEA